MKPLITTLLSLLMASLFPLAMGKAVSHDISSLQLAVRGDNRAHTDGDASGGDAPGLRVDVVGFLLYLCYISDA